MELSPLILKWLTILLRWSHVFFAIKNAIASIANYNLIPELNAPATPERILMSITKLKSKI